METRKLLSMDSFPDSTENTVDFSKANNLKSHNRLNKDKNSILLLLFLYLLQGIPLGLASSIPMILQNRKVSYKEQAFFTLVNWPFCLKLLWAPIVDSLYYKRLGRRKTWLIATQYLIGFFMILLSRSVSQLLGDSDNIPNVSVLTTFFFFMNFLAATQDIAVDGWALTMLSRENVSYSSTCNIVGQSAGFFLGNVVFLELESAEFCNKYLRYLPQAEGLITLSGFLKFWGIVFIITTSLVLIFKNENQDRNSQNHGIKETYFMLYSIFKLHNVFSFACILITLKIPYATTDSVTDLKLIEAGVRKEDLALIRIPTIFVNVFLPLMISKYTSGPKPLSAILAVLPFRYLFIVVFAAIFSWTHIVKEPSGFPACYYFVLVISYIMLEVTLTCITVSRIAFCAKISDPSIGGTYMTLFNTLSNLGGTWPQTFALWFLDSFTYKKCDGDILLSCNNKDLADKCINAGHKCVTTIDGYYIETAICFIFGFLWLKLGKRAIRRLQCLPLSAWKCPSLCDAPVMKI